MLGEITLPLPADELELATGAGFGIHSNDEPELEVPAAAAEGAVVVREFTVENGMEFDRAAVETARWPVRGRGLGFDASVHEPRIAVGTGPR
jgi:hypothetical protein